MNRGHRARNEHRAASPTINVNHLKHCRAFREASPEIAAQLSGASKPPPPAAPCPGGIFAAVAIRGVRQEIEILLWALVVALACCLYAPELDIQ